MNIEIIETATTGSKLTIGKNRVTIKYPFGTSEEIKTRQYKLAEKVAKSIQHPDMITRRGNFFYVPEQDKFCITVYIQTNSKGNKVDPIVFLETKED